MQSFEILENLWAIFMHRDQLPQGCRVTLRRHLKSPRAPSTHLTDLTKMKG